MKALLEGKDSSTTDETDEATKAISELSVKKEEEGEKKTENETQNA
jgi:hypothetical protein